MNIHKPLYANRTSVSMHKIAIRLVCGHHNSILLCHVCSGSVRTVVKLVLHCSIMTSCTSACVNMPCFTALFVITDMFPLYVSPSHGHGCVCLAFPRFYSAIIIDSALWLFIYLFICLPWSRRHWSADIVTQLY